VLEVFLLKSAMGLITSRRSAGTEEPEVNTGNPYRYPPRSGKLILSVTRFISAVRREKKAGRLCGDRV